MKNTKKHLLTLSCGLLLLVGAACQAAADQPPPVDRPTDVGYPEPILEAPVDDYNPYPGTDPDLSYAILLNPELAPQEDDANLQRGMAFVSSSDLFLLESYPVQVRLQLLGDLPTPCHALRVVVSKPDEQNRIMLDVYSVVDPNMICIQVMEAFDVTLALGDFTEGSFTVWLNGEQIEEFTLP